MKKRVIIIISIVIILLITITILITIRKQAEENKTLNKIAKYYNCEFVKETVTIERGYRKKIYWNYYVPPIDVDNGIQFKEYYEEVLKAVSAQIKENFILIDNKNSIEIRVKYNSENNKINYLINNDQNYFQNEENKQIDKTNNEENKSTNLNIKSKELSDTIENEWSRKKTENSYGIKTKNENNYDIYSKGIKVRTINSMIYNIVFLKEYQGEIFENITTGMKNEDIKKILGEPTYENEQDNILIGYKTDKYYVFFDKGQISIYPNQNTNEEKNKQFAELVGKYITDINNYTDFLNKVTELYPDYSEYVQNEDGIDLKYPLKGLEIKMGKNEKTGMYIYSNYNGYIMNDKKREDLDDNTINNIYLVNSNYVYEEELNRIMEENLA